MAARAVAQILLALDCARAQYERLDLSTPSGGLRAALFPPPADASDPAALGAAFYRSSRFDWGSMLGGFELPGGHTLCEPGFWRAPHDPACPESAVGLAGEFGCGSDGSVCPPGWDGGAPLGNGLLGYDEARPGGPFLKIGVGALVKGSCAGCDPSAPADTYRFNAPYAFAAPPVWSVTRLGPSAVALEHSAALPGGEWAYALRRTVELLELPEPAAGGGEGAAAVGGRVRESWALANRGSRPLSSPFYSHNFYSAERRPTDSRWALQLDGLDAANYTDGAPSWAQPLAAYAHTPPPGAGAGARSALQWAREVGAGLKLKATFGQPAEPPSGAFSLACGGLRVASEQALSRAQGADGSGGLYAFNLYVEAATLSPEPIVSVRLRPGEQARWTRTLTLTAQPREGEGEGAEEPAALPFTAEEQAPRASARAHLVSAGGLLASAAAALLLALRRRRAQRLAGETPWPRAALAASASSALLGGGLSLGSSGGRGGGAECELLGAHERRGDGEQDVAARRLGGAGAHPGYAAI